MAALPAHNTGVEFYEPRQQMCWDFYVDPKSESFGNARKSAIRAGYGKSAAQLIWRKAWFARRAEQLAIKEGMLSKAERALHKALVYSTDKDILDKGVVIGKIVNTKLLAIQVDAAKHVTKTLGKNEGWAERQELTGKDGAALPVPILNVILFNHRDKEDNGAKQANPGSARRDFGEQDGIDNLVIDSPGAE